MSKTADKERMSLWIMTEQREKLEKYASSKRMSKSDVMRIALDKFFMVEGYVQGEDLIRTYIREEIHNAMDPKVERLAKISVKAGTVAAAAWFLFATLLAKLMPPRHRSDWNELLTESKKRGSVYIQRTHDRIDQDFVLNNIVEEGMLTRFDSGGTDNEP